MRWSVVLIALVCLSACGSVGTQQMSMGSGQTLLGPDRGLMDPDALREKQAVLDAEAILQGMAQARHRAEELARTSR